MKWLPSHSPPCTVWSEGCSHQLWRSPCTLQDSTAASNLHRQLKSVTENIQSVLVRIRNSLTRQKLYDGYPTLSIVCCAQHTGFDIMPYSLHRYGGIGQWISLHISHNTLYSSMHLQRKLHVKSNLNFQPQSSLHQWDITAIKKT